MKLAFRGDDKLVLRSPRASVKHIIILSESHENYLSLIKILKIIDPLIKILLDCFHVYISFGVLNKNKIDCFAVIKHNRTSRSRCN